jgi:predicted dehydrogenase
MGQIRVAVVGAGFIGPVHVEALRRLGIEVSGILGADAAESQLAKEKLNLPKAYRSFDQVLGDGAVQSVHLAVPNRLHCEMAKRALEAGKHVMCEKPLAMNSRESAELVALARKSGRAAGVNHNGRYYPLCIEVADMYRRGDLGEVYSACGSYVQDWLFYPTDYNWRVLAEEGGELRAISDIGTHWLDLMYAVAGLEVESLCADLKVVHGERRRPRGEVQTFKGNAEQTVETEPIRISTEDHGSVLLRFRGGARGLLWVSQVTAGRKDCLRFEIAGSKCAVSWDSEEANELWIGHRDRSNESLLRDPALLSHAARRFANYPGGHIEGFPDSFKQCFRSFYDYIQAGDFSAPPTYPTFVDGHRQIVLCEAILKSYRENCWVELRGDRAR